MLFGGSGNKNDTNKSTLKITIQVNVESIQCYLGGGGSRNKNDTNKSTQKITIQVNVERIQCYLGGLETKIISIRQH